MAVEEIRDVTWGLLGQELRPWQAAQRLYKAGFTDVDDLVTAWAVMESESGGYLKAWHINVVRNPDGSIKRTTNQLGDHMMAKSIDMGFIQRNVPFQSPVELLMNEATSTMMVETLFGENPELADGQKSANIAHQLFLQRGWQPWYAYSNGNWKRPIQLARAIEAVANFLGNKYLNDSDLVRRV